MKSPYEVLGVPRDVDDAGLKRAYREAAKRLHPDAGARNDAAMVRLNAAYDLLRDPAKRKAWDAANPAERKPGPAADAWYAARVLAPIDAAVRAAVGAVEAAADARAEDVEDDDLARGLEDALDAAEVALRGARWDLGATRCPKPLAAGLRGYMQALDRVETALARLRDAADDEDGLGQERGRLGWAVGALAEARAAIR